MLRTRVLVQKYPSWEKPGLRLSPCPSLPAQSRRWTWRGFSSSPVISCQALSWTEAPQRVCKDKHLQMGQRDRLSPREGRGDESCCRAAGILAAAPARDPQLCRLNSDDTGATGGQSCSADGLRVQERTPRSFFWAPFFPLVPLLTTSGSCLWPGTPGWDSGATPVTRGKGKVAPGVQQPPSCPVGPVALG